MRTLADRMPQRSRLGGPAVAHLGRELARDINLTPSRWIGGRRGYVAVPLAALLTWEYHLGFASVAACAYMHSNYWLPLLLERAPARKEDPHRRQAPSSTTLPIFLRAVRSGAPQPRRRIPGT